MKDSGYLIISRKLFEHWLYPEKQDRKFTQFEAWLSLIASAKFICVKKSIQNKLIIIPRGYLDCTVAQLAEKWRWDMRTVNKFLNELKNDDMISLYKINKSKKSCTLLKINNYNDFQPEIWETCKSEYKTKCGLICKRKCTPNNESKVSVSNYNFSGKNFSKNLSGKKEINGWTL